jgi:hypothetical protein
MARSGSAWWPGGRSADRAGRPATASSTAATAPPTASRAARSDAGTTYVSPSKGDLGGMPAEPREVGGGMDAEQPGVVGLDGFPDGERVPERVAEAVQHGLERPGRSGCPAWRCAPGRRDATP